MFVFLPSFINHIVISRLDIIAPVLKRIQILLSVIVVS